MTERDCRHPGCVYWALNPERGFLYCGQHNDQYTRSALPDPDEEMLTRLRADHITSEDLDPEAGPGVPEDEELAYEAHLLQQDGMTLAHFLLHLDRRGSVSLPSDIAEVVERVYARESEKHLGRNGR